MSAMTWILQYLHYIHSVPSPRGALVGLAPPNKAPSPPNWNIKHYKFVEFLSNLNVKPPLHERKPSLLTPFWPRFCIHKHKRRKGRGRRGPWPIPTFGIWHFPDIFLTNKLVYLVSSGKNEISPFLPTLRKSLASPGKFYYCPPWYTTFD